MTDNRAVDPSNFSEFCITAPPAIPARRGDAAAAVIQALPGAGQRMCGFWTSTRPISANSTTS